jgi:hypothetical protein
MVKRSLAGARFGMAGTWPVEGSSSTCTSWPETTRTSTETDPTYPAWMAAGPLEV